jgi:4,5-DOPA dioxygenase extradiol
MNAIEDNSFTDGWMHIANVIPKPEAILCISAHWYIPGTRVLAIESPRTIHDYYGFPQKLYQQKYPAPGDVALAKKISQLAHADLDTQWGFDHGAWVVLKRMFPQANIPTVQLSIDYTKPPQYHYDLMVALRELRGEGILIMGSGNLVHNLSAMNPNMAATGYNWNISFATKIRASIMNHDNEAAVNYQQLGTLARHAHPTPDHFYPLLYALGAIRKGETVQSFSEGYAFGSISMDSFAFGLQ